MNTYLIIGLGNPGREYRETRHNVGFMLVDRLAVKLNARFTRMQSNAIVASTNFQEQRIILAKPQTFMNLSGQSVRGLIRHHKIDLSSVLIAHDDLDLPLGSLRIRPDGGSGGQKGVASILDSIGTDEFPRMRIGIGRPPGRMPAADYVLEEFSLAETTLITQTLNRCIDAVFEILSNGIAAAMSKYNTQPQG